MKTRQDHIYSFYNSRMHLHIKAKCLSEAIEWLKVIFGDKWVNYNLDDLEISRYTPNKK